MLVRQSWFCQCTKENPLFLGGGRYIDISKHLCSRKLISDGIAWMDSLKIPNNRRKEGIEDLIHAKTPPLLLLMSKQNSS